MGAVVDRGLLDWLMEGGPWLRYAVETQLRGLRADASAAVGDPLIRSLVDRLRSPHVGIPALAAGRLSYANTGNAFWDLFFLADVGLTAAQVGIADQVDTLLDRQQPDGSFTLGSDPSYYCRSAIVLSSVAALGYKDDPRVARFVRHVLDEQRPDGGWHCLPSPEACPQDNLNVLMLLGQYDEYREDGRLTGALDLLLDHWSRRADGWRPAGFGVGERFRKIEYPAVKYGILRVLDVLSRFPHALRSGEFADMLRFVESKAPDGRYYAESVPAGYSGFDFAQTLVPSRWITFIVSRVRQRASRYVKM